MTDIYEILIGYNEIPTAQKKRELLRVTEEIKNSYKSMGLPDPSLNAENLERLCREILDDLLYTTNGKGLYNRITIDKV